MINKHDAYQARCLKLIQQAVKLEPNLSQLARELGVSRCIVHQWRQGTYAMRPGNFATLKAWVELAKGRNRNSQKVEEKK